MPYFYHIAHLYVYTHKVKHDFYGHCESELQPVYITGRIALNRFALIPFDYRSTFTPVVLNQITSRLGSIRGTAFTCVVRITRLLIQSSSIQFNSSTTVQGGTIGIEAVRLDSCLYYE